MRLFITVRRRTLFSVLLILIIFCFLASAFFDVQGKTAKNGDTHKKRTDFLSSIDCEIYDEKAKEKEIIIPTEFSSVYENYNALLKTAGYDLTAYKGEKCTVYTYNVKHFADFKDDDYSVVNLIVYKGRIIGGDISSAKLDGRMYPIKKYEKNKT